MILVHEVAPTDEGKTVKFILKIRLGLSERLVKRLKYAGQILLNNQPVYVNVLVAAGDILEAIVEFDEENENVIPEEKELDIIYEDSHIVAVNKGPNTVVHPTFGHPTGTLANALVHHFQKAGKKSLVRPVNRLDRDTSGIVIFACNQYVQERLSTQMKEGTFHKEYIGIVHGLLQERKGSIRLPIERKPGSIMLRQVSPGGSPSVTHFEVLEYLNDATYVKFVLETGRTHQIRVHCQAIGHPLVGDTLYAGLQSEASPAPIQRQALHSSLTSFIHPVTCTPLLLTAPIPQDFKVALEILGK